MAGSFSQMTPRPEAPGAPTAAGADRQRRCRPRPGGAACRGRMGATHCGGEAYHLAQQGPLRRSDPARSDRCCPSAAWTVACARPAPSGRAQSQSRPERSENIFSIFDERFWHRCRFKEHGARAAGARHEHGAPGARCQATPVRGTVVIPPPLTGVTVTWGGRMYLVYDRDGDAKIDMAIDVLPARCT